MRIVPVFCLSCLVAAGADRSILNRDLPSWINLGVQGRLRAEGQHGLGFQEGMNQDYLLERYRFSTDLRPANWLQFVGEIQDSRVAGLEFAGANVKDTLDLRQAWVGIGSEGGLWDLKAGRQRLRFGSERVVGASEWGNVGRVFDAVRLGVHNSRDRVDIFASSVVRNDVDQWDHHQQGNNLHGVYASLGSILPDVKLEPYLLLRTSPAAVSELGRAGRYHSWTGGFRSSGVIRENWSYETELIRQTGRISNSRLSAWAATIQVQRRFPSLRWQPSVLAEANYASGDRNRSDGVMNTFDQLYPTNHGIYGIVDQIGRRNTKNVRGGVWLRPKKWLTLKAEAHSFWLASRHDALYAAGGTVSVPAPAGGALSAHVGREMDLLADMKISRYYNIGVQYGHLFPGKFLKTYTPGAAREYYAVYLDVHL